MGRKFILPEWSNIKVSILEENLSWESHINYISLKLRKANGALSKIRYYVPNKPYDHYIFHYFIVM